MDTKALLANFTLGNIAFAIAALTAILCSLEAQVPKLVQHEVAGLKGPIVMNFPPPPEGFGYGISFYSAVWPLLNRPLDSFQIGLPSTWIIPQGPSSAGSQLCPPGTPAADQHWDLDRHGSFADVFQTIEGSGGFWASTRFPSEIPKYRMNGTPNCYSREISSPGWGFGRTSALRADEMGIVQLSNRILVPPDGMTFDPAVHGEMLGLAWMALPLVDADNDTGDKSWTLFLAASNFKGPVAFWLPTTWSEIGKAYPPDRGWGLDTRAAIMRSGAMEFNTVPWFESTDAKGTVYSRIPRLHFPVDTQGTSLLMENVTAWSAVAIFNPTKSWLKDGAPAPDAFDLRGAWTPAGCSVYPLYFRQGSAGSDHHITGLERFAQTTILDANTCAWGLKWEHPEESLPEYYRQTGSDRVAILESEVPPETQLRPAEFRPAQPRGPYVSPGDGDSVWMKPGPASRPYKVTLNDGSSVTFRWYRFVDQPAIQHLGLRIAERMELQSRIERIQAAWRPGKNYMPPATRGRLAALENALLVTPPPGFEVGYVPVVVRQE